MLAPSHFEKLYNKSYFEAGRSLKNHSLPSVNEDFEGEPDAKRALLDSFFFIKTIYSPPLFANRRCDASTPWADSPRVVATKSLLTSRLSSPPWQRCA